MTQRNDQGELLGGGNKSLAHKNKPGPPMRPPPPHFNANSGQSSSPAHKVVGQPQSATTKSAFDDINDSIRVALVGGGPSSPSKALRTGFIGGPPNRQQHLFPSSSSPTIQLVEGLLLIHSLLFVPAFFHCFR